MNGAWRPVQSHAERDKAGSGKILVRVVQVAPAAELDRDPRAHEHLDQRAARRLGFRPGREPPCEPHRRQDLAALEANTRANVCEPAVGEVRGLYDQLQVRRVDGVFFRRAPPGARARMQGHDGECAADHPRRRARPHAHAPIFGRPQHLAHRVSRCGRPSATTERCAGQRGLPRDAHRPAKVGGHAPDACPSLTGPREGQGRHSARRVGDQLGCGIAHSG